MESLSRVQLMQKMSTDTRFALVEVLPPQEYDKGHLPGAMNIPLGNGFERTVAHTLPDKEQHVVVYCSDMECPASPTAARKLEKMGYRNVFDYAGGKEDWSEAGLRMDANQS